MRAEASGPRAWVPAWILVVALLSTGLHRQALAQTMSDATAEAADPAATPIPIRDDHASTHYKGSIGLGLIGAELGAVIPALAGARAWWAFVAFPLLGAAGGALAGYYALERGNADPDLAVGALITGMALVIPAAVVTMAASAYERDTELQLGTAPRMRRAAVAAKAATAVAAGAGLVRVSERGMFISPPLVSIGASVSACEAMRTGAPRVRVLRVALLSGVF